MKAKTTVHVVPNNGKWSVKESGIGKPKSTHQLKDTALDNGRHLAKTLKTELVIHKRDGRIQDKDSFGSDRNPPKDKVH